MEDEYPSAAADGPGDPSPGEAAALARRMDRPVVLVGMMGVGKTSLGKRLAAALGAPFIDADEEIERAARMSIPEIFANFGEPYFRDGERRVIARLLGAGDEPADAEQTNNGRAGGNPVHHSHPVPIKIIATGGGAFCDAGTRALILARGIAVWLDADLDTLVERTSRKENRPLLRQGNPREILARLKAEREPAYAQAPIHVISGKGPHSRTLSRVLDEIARWLDAAGIDVSPAPENDA